MIGFERAQRVAEHLWAQAEVRESRPAALILMMGLTTVAAVFPQADSWRWFAGMIGASLLGVPVLRKVLPTGNLTTYRLYPVSVVLNAAMMGVVAFLQAAKLPRIELEEIPQVRWLFPALSLLIPLGYLLVAMPVAFRRWRQRNSVATMLPKPDDPEAYEEVVRLVRPALVAPPTSQDPWAEFETVPPGPGNWKAFLKPDFEPHGVWRMALGNTWGVVVRKNGSGAEAVRPGAFKLVSDDPKPGNRRVVCLLRWNQHLKEGRILWEERLKIQAWNAGDRGATVPLPY